MGPIIIQTERLNLRTWTSRDRAAFALIAHEPEVVRWLNRGEPLPADQIDGFIARQVGSQRERGWCRWAVELRETVPEDPTGIVGFCGFGCNLAPEVELGWTLLPQLWGRGLATEAGRAALKYGFETIGFAQVFSAILPENAASRAVADKCGLVLDGVFLEEGEPTLRYVAHNPHPDAQRDGKFILSCEARGPSVLRPGSGDATRS
ncbi:MAG: GNAT family N-acetyltransferase [Coriobacteriia bacterium]|nr:GNAT family N-acetyltransferase [Coriobacteriia bacterium]